MTNKIRPVIYALLAVMLLGLVSARSAHAQTPFVSMLDHYLNVQGRLAGDSLEGVKDEAAAIETVAATLGDTGAALTTAAGSLSRASDLQSARNAFGDLSDALIAYGDSIGARPGPGVEIAYCPMVQKSWLQRGAAIKNPYYGRSMLTCGQLKTKTASPSS